MGKRLSDEERALLSRLLSDEDDDDQGDQGDQGTEEADDQDDVITYRGRRYRPVDDQDEKPATKPAAGKPTRTRRFVT